MTPETFPVFKSELKVDMETWEDKLDFRPDQDNLDLELTIEKIEKMIKIRENFLGSGGAAKVYNLEVQCIKLIKNRHGQSTEYEYDLGNHPQKEFEIQSSLNNFSSSGVSSPRALRYYIGDKTAAIVMQKLDAVNMQLVLNGEQKLPSNFDIDDFFFRLESYIGEIHDVFGIAHNDLYPRNIMIDNKTGMPYVIDFGRSILKTDGASFFEKKARDDFDKVNSAYDKIKEFIDKSKNV
jgi:tRNA A-37 threonylcarbamoyl transferase component Bud32